MILEAAGMLITLCALFGGALLHAKARGEDDDETRHTIVRAWSIMLGLLVTGSAIDLLLAAIHLR